MAVEVTLIERKGFKSGLFTFYYRFLLKSDGSISIERDGWKYKGHELDPETIKSIRQYGKWALFNAGEYSKGLKQRILQMKLPLGTA